VALCEANCGTMCFAAGDRSSIAKPLKAAMPKGDDRARQVAMSLPVSSAYKKDILPVSLAAVE
jgi:hypothetical protein